MAEVYVDSPVEDKHTSLDRSKSRTKAIPLIVLGALLSSIVIVMKRDQWPSPLDRWILTFTGLLTAIGVDADRGVLSLCACAALLSGFLLLNNQSSKAGIVGWQTVRFLLHLAALYAIVLSCTSRLSGWTKEFLLPFLSVPTSSSSFEFLFSHIFAFSFIPALIAGFANAKFKHKIAQYVWLVPTVVLAYEFFAFPEPARSVLDSQTPNLSRFSAAFHEYFGGGFLIGEYRNWRDFWDLVESNPDMIRGMTQLKVTAPFYAGIGYSLAAWISLRFQVLQKFAERVKAWEHFKFDRQ